MRADDDEDKAALANTKLGGTVTRDEKAEGLSTTWVFKRLSVTEAIAFAADNPPPKDKKLDGLRSAVFSPDGLRIAAVSDSLPGYPDTLKVWDVATGKLALAIPAPKKFLRSVLFTPDGKQLISSCRYLFLSDEVGLPVSLEATEFTWNGILEAIVRAEAKANVARRSAS